MAEPKLDDLLNGKQGKFWNYGNQSKEDYRPQLVGTLVKVTIGQEHEFGKPGVLKYWEDGNPVILLRLHVRDADGEDWLFDVKPKSTLWFEDIQPACPEGSLSNVLGSMVRLTFEGLVPVTGRSVNRNKFRMEVLGQGQYPSEGFDPTMPKTRQQAQGMAQPQPSPQQYQAQRMVQPQQQAQAMYQAQQRPPQQMSPVMQQAYQVAQQYGAQLVQPGQPTYAAPAPQAPATEQPPVDVYDSDIPF